MRTKSTLTALAFVAAAFASGCASSKGYERSENLAESIDGTVAAVDACGRSRQIAFQSMTVLSAEPLDNLSGKFDTFSDSVDEVVTSDGRLRGALQAMRASATDRYQAWNESNRSYTDSDMQDQSRKNRDEASSNFQETVEDTDAMLARSADFVAYLCDLRRTLSSDLSARGVATAGEFTEKARDSSDELDAMARPLRLKLVATSNAMRDANSSR